MVSGRACLFVVTGLWLANWADPALAQEEPGCEVATANFTSLQGSAELKRARSEDWRTATLGDVLCPGDSVRTGDRSRAGVLLVELETTSRLDQNTELTLGPEDENGRSLLDIARGVIHFLSQVPRRLNVQTPFVNAAVEGTEFLVSVEAERASIIVFQGTMLLSNERGTLQLASGQSAVAVAGEAPQIRIVARPRDAVQWAIYFPPILIGLAAGLPSGLREAILARRRGAVAEAFRHLEEVAEAERDAIYFVYRAGLLLAVGRLDEARSDIDRALAQSPENAEANALLTVISVALAVTRDDVGEALQAGQRAVELSPQSSVAKIALSYALQAIFELESARDTLLQAVEAQPNDGLAWARLAELWLTLGYTRRALKAAETAASRAPGLSRTNTVLGFAALAQINTAKAKTAFETAIGLDSADPLPRLGLGLAKIREGALRKGRSDLQIAASLDPNNALIRSYLGKAYFEERRSPLAAEQLELAKELDPNDPTPWLYDAIRKQSENRPVEALRDLQKSIELNDNRAVYRSRLLLDEDLAARGARLGSIYRDLGFEQLALVEGWKSVNIDPSNHSAHRLLADTYSVLPRHQIARDSELLQSQLLQPININPVEPRLGDNGLAFLDDTGPADVGFNEFSRLFAANQLQFQASGLTGDDDTLADDLTLSGIFGKMSFSIGQFHFETDGIRANNELVQDIFNTFVQFSPTPDTSLQLELRSVDEEKGDRGLLFDPENFFQASEQDFDTQSIRLGFRKDFGPNSTLIGSYVHRKLNDDLDTGGGLRIILEDNANFFELRHLYQSDQFNITGGAGFLDSDIDETVQITPFPGLTITSITESKVIHRNGYVYGSLNYPEDVVLTIGLSADSYESNVIHRDQVNPKAGLIWDITPSTTLRAAGFRVVKRTLTASQTLEPTQVAGFNQFFDDIDGTDSTRYGVAIDQKFDIDRSRAGAEIFAGIEVSERDLRVPTTLLSPTRVEDIDWEDKFARAYINWTPFDWLAVSAEYQYERLVRDIDANNAESFAESKTHRVPLELRFFYPSGLFARARATYVDQEGQFSDITTAVLPGSDNFWSVDMTLGYRFPSRRGLATLEIRNVFDEEFKFQDTEPTNSLIKPERSIIGRLTLVF